MTIRRGLILLTFLALLGYGAVLARHVSFAVGGSDSSGYANTARMLVTGRLVSRIEALDRLGLPDRFDRVFMPLAYEPGPRPGTMAPFYPPGYPLHFAAAGLLFGWDHAPYFVNPLAALLLVLLTYLLARELQLSQPLAIACAAILAACAVLVSQAEQAMSDVTAALWVAAAILFALRSRHRDAWAAAAGAAFGMAVLVRPANALAGVPLLLALAWRPRTFALLAAGGLPFAAFQFWWSETLYGNPLRTGYGGLGDFQLATFPQHLGDYARSLTYTFSPLVPFGWLGVAGSRQVPLRDRALLILWFAPYFLLYCFWGPWFPRFLLPAFPALVIAAILTARNLLRRLPAIARGPLRSQRAALAVGAVLLLLVVDAERRELRRRHPLRIAEDEKIYPLSMELARSMLPERSLVLSMQVSGSLRYSTSFQPVRWDWLDPADFPLLREKARARGYRLFALLFSFEEEVIGGKIPGTWKVIGHVRDARLWELE